MSRLLRALPLLLALALATPAFARGNNGLGFVLGEPTGIVFKHWSARDRAIDAGLSFSFNDFFLLYADYLFHWPGGFGTNEKFIRELIPYVGIGTELFFSTDNGNRHYFTGDHSSSVGFGVRIPLGIEWMTPNAPFGIFLELTPGIGLIPGTFGFLQGGIGARFYF